jgi:hypothetical protein
MDATSSGPSLQRTLWDAVAITPQCGLLHLETLQWFLEGPDTWQALDRSGLYG